jgi:hypothetical protein
MWKKKGTVGSRDEGEGHLEVEEEGVRRGLGVLEREERKAVAAVVVRHTVRSEQLPQEKPTNAKRLCKVTINTG